jgi:NLP/P60 family protein
MSGGILHMIYDISSSCEDGEKYSRMIVSTRNFQNIRGTAAIDTLDSIGFIAPAP